MLKWKQDPSKLAIQTYIDKVLYAEFKELIKNKYTDPNNKKKFSLLWLSKYCEQGMREFIREYKKSIDSKEE